MIDIGFLPIILGIITICVGLFFSFKYFPKTTTIVLLSLITWGLVWDYQVSKFPVYDLSSMPEWYFDQERNILSEDQDQYMKLLAMINDYATLFSSANVDQYKDLQNNYYTTLSKTWTELTTFFKNQSIQILSFEKELLKNTNISLLEWIINTWVWWDLDPLINIKSQINDWSNWSQGLVRNLTMIWWTYCYMYSLQNSGVENGLLEERCVSYFDQASAIAEKQYNRKWWLISKLIAFVNAQTVFSSLNNMNFDKLPINLKLKVTSNLSFLWTVSEQEFIKQYKVDEYNTLYISSIDDLILEDIERLNGRRIFDDFEGLTFIPLLTNSVKYQSIADAKFRAMELWKYFFMFEDADQPIQELARSRARYEKSVSRFLLAKLGIDKWEFISYSLGARSVNYLVPRLTWVEKRFIELKEMYLEYIQ